MWLKNKSENFRAILTQRTFANLFRKLTQQYQWLYTHALGADPIQLGSVSSLNGVVSTGLSMPLGWLADKYSVKKILLLGMLFDLIAPLFYALATDWRLILPAMSLSTLAMSLTFLGYRIIVADSTGDTDRGSGFALINFLSSFPGIVAPIMAGYLITVLGGISVQSIRPLFYIQFVGLSVLWVIMYKMLRDFPFGKNRLIPGVADFKELFEGREGLKKFVFLHLLGGFTDGLISPFEMVFAKEVKNADALIIGEMGTALTAVAMLASLPLGRLSDRKGRKWSIYTQQVCSYGGILLLLFAPAPEYLILAYALRGINMGGMGWTTLEVEMVSARQRGRWGGILRLFYGLAAIPAPIIGGVLWNHFSPYTPFILFLTVEFLLRMPLLLMIPETLGSMRRKEKG